MDFEYRAQQLREDEITERFAEEDLCDNKAIEAFDEDGLFNDPENFSDPCRRRRSPFETLW